MINNPLKDKNNPKCQCCDHGDYLYNDDWFRNSYCGNCGARLDWPEDDYEESNT